MNRVIVNCNHGRRIIVYPHGGLEIETYIEGSGWVLDNDADVNNNTIASYLDESLIAIENAKSKLLV